MLRIMIIVSIMFLVGMAYAGDAVEAASSCIVIHEKSGADGENMITCFENISLEPSSFESGVCQWKTDAQATADIQTKTQFVPHCPASHSGYCDRLVLGSGMVAPVKIFLYDRSADVLERAKNQCLSGGGTWHTNDEDTQ